MMRTPRTVAAITLGCRLNQNDTALIFDRLSSQLGFEVVRLEDAGSPGLIIVNTCTVTGTAAQKSRQAVRRLRRRYPDSCIVVTGCSADIENSSWQEESAVDLLLPNPEKRNIVEHLLRFWELREAVLIPRYEREFSPVFREEAEASFPFRSRPMLKIQEGCNAFCSYCIVPYARGRERSRDSVEVLDEFKRMLEQGYREIVLTGVNVSTYSCGGLNLPGLLEKLLGVHGEFRIRLSSTEPHQDNREIVEMMAQSNKLCRFLHLPLQHGADEILKAMNRKYQREEFREFVEYARKRVPGIHIGTDFIVGFPGETDALFDEAAEFVRELAFANVHIFSYSPREGTPAAAFSGQVPTSLSRKRYERLRAICAEGAEQFLNSQIGQLLPVIFESREDDGHLSGWSDNYAKVLCASEDGEVPSSEIRHVRIHRAGQGMLFGSL